MSRERVGHLYAGVMSGTSLDGIDAVLADFAPGPRPCVLLGATHIEFPSELRRELLALQSSGGDEIVRAARAQNALADLYVHALRSVCHAAGVAAHDVVAAGVHGQTVRHRPQEGWTVQLNNPARVAERAYMTVVADFRTRDIAAGGQGAPLVPAFHAAVFGDAARHRVVANLGGIANITDLPPRGPVRGFDTGPGNVLLDAWCARHRNAPFDSGGAFAGSGVVDAGLLAALLAEPYFSAPPPKSTGRDLFNAEWLDSALGNAKWSGRRATRAGDACRVDGANARGRRADALRGHAGITGLRRWREQRRPRAEDRQRARRHTRHGNGCHWGGGRSRGGACLRMARARDDRGPARKPARGDGGRGTPSARGRLSALTRA